MHNDRVDWLSSHFIPDPKLTLQLDSTETIPLFQPTGSKSLASDTQSPPRPHTAFATSHVVALTDIGNRPGQRELANNDFVVRNANTSSSHYIKHSNRITMVLSDQDDLSSVPVYTNGSTIDGILAVQKSSGLLSLEVKVVGSIRLKELAGGGDFKAEIITETLYSWNADHHPTFPEKVTFRYTFPSHYTDCTSGERHRLPPSYEARLQGIPGFHVKVSYAILVDMARNREKADWWRKSNQLYVPFRYHELSKPARAGPFPLSVTKTPSSPQTIFSFSISAQQRNHPGIGVQLFLPYSQVCSLKEPIPFFVSIFGDDHVLDTFASHQPPSSLPSFHPISGSHSSGSTLNLQRQFLNRVSKSSGPFVSIQLQRRTLVDALAAGMVVLNQKSHMLSCKAIGKGIVHSSSRTVNSVTWSGTILISPTITDGGFAASGIKVSDLLVLTISPSETAYSQYMALCESVPLYLASECHNNSSTDIVVLDMN